MVEVGFKIWIEAGIPAFSFFLLVILLAILL